ncbi:hypothetical protein DSL72_005562 [Monilinia vaccinii-corymbosi]|uniref:Uncharacterized protein n=1 Tax=Monilinia vaccinii-corymbosi TaxID=61207 RepID=A0A8A3PFG9_9HELO|nr:hypothetical protein DSL72_005562 [Monilinia vaccinii-corymbosi]
MSTPKKHSFSADPEDQKDIKIEIVEDKPATGSAKADSSFTVVSPERVEITMTIVVPKPRENTIVMKDNHGKDMEMSLGFGKMRDATPSTDDEESGGEGETDVPITSITEKIVLATRFSQIMGRNFLSRRVMDSKEEGVKPEAAASQINKATAPKISVPKKYRHRRRGVVAGRIQLRGHGFASSNLV